MDTNGLNPTHYLSLPGYGWDCFLKFLKKSKNELFTDPDMHLMMERGIRGGLTVVVTWYVEANNHYIKVFDSTMDTSYVVYIDKNNGHPTTGMPPFVGFKWATDKDAQKIQKTGKVCTKL